MNRSIALLVALAVLLAHAFALHNDGWGGLAPPYDQAYVAFRLGRNLVHEGALVWYPGLSGVDSYPSLLWVWTCAFAERLYLPIHQVCQYLGTIAALGTLVLASRFHRDRIASLIAPLLLSLSGGMAAAAVSGNEVALTAFLVTAAFLCYERGWSLGFGLVLLLGGLTRPEVFYFGLFVLAMRAVEALFPAREGVRRPALWSFALPLAGWALLGLWRSSARGAWLDPTLRELARLEPGELAAGLAGLSDFLVVSGSPILIVFALWYLLRGRLSATGRRALFLFVAWCALTALAGGGLPQFGAALVPALPLGLIAAQEGMINTLNSTRRWLRGLAWASFLVAVTLSSLASRPPEDLGPLPLARWQSGWIEPAAPRRFGYADQLGRAGLQEELSKTATLRALGIFLRDQVESERSVLTPWPGSIAYLSRLRVFDMQGRATPLAPGERFLPWSGRRRVDVLTALERDADYLALFFDSRPRVPSPEETARNLALQLDRFEQEGERLARLLEVLLEYELIAVPLDLRWGRGTQVVRRTCYLLRRRALGLAPQLELTLTPAGDELVVGMDHRGHWQLADLEVLGIDDQGRGWQLAPTGEFVPEHSVLTRTHLLVHATGERTIELVRARLPAGRPTLVELRASLRNPGAQGTHAWSSASDEVVLRLR